MATLETDPMYQFEVQPVFELPTVLGIDLTITNTALCMIIVVLLIAGGLSFLSRRGALVPSRGQSVAELLYEFVADMAKSIMGKDGMRFFPYIFTLFTFIFVANLLGLVPGMFTVTSHIIVTLMLGLITIGTVLWVGFTKNGLGFLRLFAPAGLPLWIYPLLVPIEILSFLSRPISLAIRLFANMLAGHVLLKLFGGFTIQLVGALGLVGAGGILAILSMGILTAVTGLEFLIAFLQAYIFAVLSCIYINDALHPSH
ncbi:F0F1 ATP synthase subunit A [Hyphobacterium sp.]|uniref:F0F1 ATP synthase subunit A n=1 Tax=Hyphobacterium sp. TaxID=2004662 RepID=UPI003BAB8F64